MSTEGCSGRSTACCRLYFWSKPSFAAAYSEDLHDGARHSINKFASDADSP